MALQDKENYLLDTKELIRQGINNLGENLTNQSTFRSYKTGLDNIYSDMPKVFNTGTEFALLNTRKGKMELELGGNTEQAQLEVSDYPQDIHVVTGENTIHINNTDYPLSLGNMELCKIGEHKDEFFKNEPNNPHYDSSLIENAWYKYPNILKTAFNADTTINRIAKSENDGSFHFIFYSKGSLKVNTNQNLCNYYKNKVAFTENACFTNYQNDFTIINIFDNNFTAEMTTAEAKTKFHELYDDKLIFYTVKNMAPIQITDPILISQLDAIENAMSAEENTSITQTNADLPFIISASALKAYPSGTINITENGNNIDVSLYDSANVNVQPTLQSKLVTPTASQQIITPDANYNGLSRVTVNAVDNTIDLNIIPDNIKQGISILGVIGNVVELVGQTKTVTPTTSQQIIIPDANYNGLTSVTINPILLEQKTVTPSTTAQIVTPSIGVDGISQINVSAVDNTIDNNIQAENIKKGVTILGVIGTYEDIPTGTISISQNGTVDVSNYATADVYVPPVPYWPDIGYLEAPQSIQDGFNYARQIMNNWDTTQTVMKRALPNKDTKLQYMPLVDTSNIKDMSGAFGGDTLLQNVPVLNTSNVTTVIAMFESCRSLVSVGLFDMSNVTTAQSMFYDCNSITSIPAFDTRNTTSMYMMFYRCTNLVDLPVLNTSKVQYMESIVKYCTKLSNDSLNNLLAMAADSIPILTDKKTMQYLGLTTAQADICETLPNYSRFTAAGWTRGSI